MHETSSVSLFASVCAHILGIDANKKRSWKTALASCASFVRCPSAKFRLNHECNPTIPILQS